MHQIKLLDGNTFNCKEHETIIEGALRNNIFLDHSCLKGRCSSCKFKVLMGTTITSNDELPLSDNEKKEGYILACVRRPITDIELETEDLSVYGFSKSQTIPAKIQNIKNLTKEILQIDLKYPPQQKFQFLEGQYLNVLWKGIKRSYSIASNADNEEIQLIIKNYEGGRMSQYWFQEAKVADLLRLEIPKGTFFLRNHPDKENIIFIATGTGIAPIKSILESPKNQDKLKNYKRVIVLWGMKYQSDIFWQPDKDSIQFVPVLSREGTAKKYVQDTMEELNIDFSNLVIYSCGSNQMIQQVKSIAQIKGLSSHHFFSDAFVPSN